MTETFRILKYVKQRKVGVKIINERSCIELKKNANAWTFDPTVHTLNDSNMQVLCNCKCIYISTESYRDVYDPTVKNCIASRMRFD